MIKRSMKKISLTLLIFICIIFSYFMIINKNNKVYIDKVLESESYSYLPKEAKNYIKEVYEETGEIILTEKNKEENELYLNPMYIEYLTYSDEERKSLGEIPVSMIIDYSIREELKDMNVPRQYDMRDSYVTPVRDQGDLGVCWTFATAGVVESYLLQNDSEITIEAPLLISERQIDYVTSRNGIKDYKSEYVSFIDRSLGDGGNFYISTIAMANGISLFNYNSFKEYDDTDFTKMELYDVINYKKSQYEVNSTINVPSMSLRESTSILSEDEIEIRNSYLNEVKKNIMENGGAYVGTYMSSSCQYMDSNLNNLVIDVYNCSASGGHAMQIIGWNDDLEYSYCADTKLHNADVSTCKNVVKGKGVWILKNSWGNELKYPYLTYDSLYSSIHFIDEMTSTDDRTWDNNYVLGEGSEIINEKTYYLNNTKIKNEEKIEKIKFIAEAPDTLYNIEVYKKDGTYEKFYKTTGLPGLITIDITEDIIVDENTKIIISSEKEYIDKISVFTSNIDKTPYIDLDRYDNTEISETQIRLYSETKNIPSGTELIYRLYDLENKEITDKITFSNNIVAENNINTLVNFSKDLSSEDYRIDVIYDSDVISSINIKNVKMTGIGTKDDPYIITNSIQLSQIRDDLDAYYELGNDIDLTEDTREGGKLSLDSDLCPQGFGWESINNFNGSLDGKGHTIRGLYQNNYLICNEEKKTIYTWNNAGNGLFGSAFGNVTIKNLVLEDFDITCQGGNCGALLSTYRSNNLNYSDETEYIGTFENIVLRNSKISGVYNSKNGNSSMRHSNGGGLFSELTSLKGIISISNIYLDFEIDNKGDKSVYSPAYLSSTISGKTLNINNIQLKGIIDGKYDDGSDDSVLVGNISSNNTVNINNILSTTLLTNNTGTQKNILFSYVNGQNVLIDSINLLNILDRKLFRIGCTGSNCIDPTNINVYDKETELNKLTDKSNYSSWKNFKDNWIIKTIDGIPRFPVLNFVDFEYTKINDIKINQELNENKNIYDYINPNIDSAKRISYKSNDENIVKIDDNGVIIPQSTGNTTIHIESYYDGYINDVPISIDYVPHYTIHFDSNDTEDYFLDIEGTMESIEVEAGKSFKLPANKFTQEYYEFKEWNTKPDGSGISYSDLSEIPAMNDKDEITLYVQWWGKERVVNFNAAGGSVSPDKKIVRVRTEYGELPIPVRPGYGFKRWDEPRNTIYIDAFTQLVATELTAKWVEDAYTIIYDGNGGNIQKEYKNISYVYLISESLFTTYAKNAQIKGIEENIYEKLGYKFKEWNTKPDGSGISYLEDDTIQLADVENSTFRLYAIWEKQSYSVIFDANGGEFANNKTTFIIEEWEDNKLDSLERPTKNGYTFKGYFTEKTGGTSLGKYIAEAGIDKDGLVFYAQWEPIQYNVEFKANGGIGAMEDQIFTYDTLQNLKTNVFTKEGFVFKEWNTKADGTGVSYSDGQRLKISENLILYAIWEESYKYIITEYTYDEVNKQISKIMVNTTVDDFKNNIKLNTGYKISVDSKTIEDKKILYTGGKTKIYNDVDFEIEFTNIVIGDINGDGAINSGDLLKIRQHLLGTVPLFNEYSIAADVNYDIAINSGDLFKLRQHLLGTVPIS